jgi:hypothetical protein
VANVGGRSERRFGTKQPETAGATRDEQPTAEPRRASDDLVPRPASFVRHTAPFLRRS